MPDTGLPEGSYLWLGRSARRVRALTGKERDIITYCVRSATVL